MYYVYLLKSENSQTKYIGCTENLKKRLKTHNSGKVKSTKNKIPLRLIYYEAFLNKYDAFSREKELKTEYTKKKHLIARLKNSLDLNDKKPNEELLK
ncbi:GIY-YIG nuclease family protein [Candidatus Giovannonibacteria bacterium]|nr:GIY-YIG nuclease family protein [Candidatus Giovannonibacteria bacterium]